MLFAGHVVPPMTLAQVDQRSSMIELSLELLWMCVLWDGWVYFSWGSILLCLYFLFDIVWGFVFTFCFLLCIFLFLFLMFAATLHISVRALMW